MIRQTMHDVTKLKIGKVKTMSESREREFHTLTITVTGINGEALELVLFSDDKNAFSERLNK
tara:strand:- start:1271 stop:1456 length:186 start_codon:yes stop_codon:yes gene_type:complete